MPQRIDFRFTTGRNLVPSSFPIVSALLVFLRSYDLRSYDGLRSLQYCRRGVCTFGNILIL